MPAGLIVRKEDSELLFDTTKIVYGLKKSGYTTYHGRWIRWGTGILYDDVYKFVVKGGKSPICFTVGLSMQPYRSREGDDYVFYFAACTGPIKCYVFDVMDDVFTGPGLKTREEDGKLSFNSLQIPLNITATATPPPPGPAGAQGVSQAFNGSGAQVIIPEYTGVYNFWAGTFATTALTAGVEYAAYIPWSRGGVLVYFQTSTWAYSVREGCYGGVGGVTHVFGAAGEGTCQGVHSTTPMGWYYIARDRMPTSLVIKTADYPFPFDGVQPT